MIVHVTVDQQGVDGFGFGEEMKRFRQLRAQANASRGMEYWECEILEEERKKLLDMFEDGKFQELKKWLQGKRL